MEHTTNIQMKRENTLFFSSFAFIEDCSKLKLDQVESSLHPIEYQRYESFKSELRKVSFILGRYCAKKAIASLYNINHLSEIHIDSGIFSQPIIKSPNIPNMRVSISHEGLSAVALAYPEEHPMGIDIESIDERKTFAIKEHLTTHEQQLSKGLNCEETLFHTILWTAKEGLSKVLKTGLTTSLTILEVHTLELYNGKYFRGTFTNFFQYQTISTIYNNKVITMLLPRRTVVEFGENYNLFTKN
jgi:4'-phosphopantetheinyl transferase